MGEKKFHSAIIKRKINNTNVHIVLAMLAAISIFQIKWLVLTSLRAEKGYYISIVYVRSIPLENST